MSGRDPADSIKSLRERLEAGERGGSDVDRAALLEFSDNIRLIPSEVGDYRHRDILRHAVRMSEGVDAGKVHRPTRIGVFQTTEL